ncbi:MAG: hypothetical protein OEU32_06605 [Acidimicrobiia bacterium]|nr:hypothetical protein [Acidimicrobiia bacterium]
MSEVTYRSDSAPIDHRETEDARVAGGDRQDEAEPPRGREQTERERLQVIDWVVLVSVITIQAIWVGRLTRDYFLVDDFWAMLGDGDLTWRDLVEDHGGHWTAYHRLAANLFYDLFGLSYWPGWGLFAALSWGGFALWSAWAVNRLGGSRLASISAGVLVGMGIGVAFKPWLVGKIVGHVSWVSASILISGPQTRARRRWLFVALTAGVAAGFQTVCFLIAATGYCLVRRGVRYWLPACLGAGAVYIVWRQAFVTTPRTGAADLNLETIASIPYLMFDVVNSAVARYLDISFPMAAVLTVVIAGFLLYRVFAGKASHHEILSSLLLVVFSATIVYSRVLTDISPASAPRYTLPVVLFIVLGYFPSISVGLARVDPVRTLTVVAAFIVPLLWILSTQSDIRTGEFEFETRRAEATEEIVTTAAYLLEEGIPFFPDYHIRPTGQGGGTLRLRQLDILVDDGLSVEPNTSDIAEIQALMTMKSTTTVTPSADAVCTVITERTAITQDQFVVAGAPGRVIEIGWTELEGGPGSVDLTFDVEGQFTIEFAEIDGAGYWLDPRGGQLQWCVP